MTIGANTLAVVTGASRGIGRAIGARLRESGVRVVGLARSLTTACTKDGGEIRCDVTSESDVQDAAAVLVKACGVPDVLVNNAGAFLLQDFAATTAHEFRIQMETNALGPFLVLRAFAPQMAAQAGHVVTVGSVADYQIFPGNAAYGSSKHALRALHEVLAAEYHGRLRTTLISPGPTDTELWDPLDPDRRDDLPDRSKMLRSDDVVDAVVFSITRPAHANIDLIRLSPSGL